MKRIFAIYFTLAIVISLIAALAGCELPVALPFARSSPTPSWGIAWQNPADQLKALHQGLVLPEHLRKAPAIKLESDFDVNRYFSVLDHLSLEGGYTLDYVYNLSSLGGLPFLYARPTGAATYPTYDDFAHAEPGKKVTSYLEKVRADGTPESYYQLAVLSQLGGQFYLYWHTASNDHQILTNPAVLNKVIDDLTTTGYGVRISTDQAARARMIDPEPRIEIGAESVTVRFVVFTKWGGFRRSSTTFHKEFPHTIIDQKTETLVEYQCGVIF